MRTIIFYNPWTEEPVGTWTLNDDGSIDASPGVADILDVTLNRTTVGDAWAQYASWSNGYLASIEEVAADTKAWNPHLHPRDLFGRFVQVSPGHWVPEGDSPNTDNVAPLPILRSGANESRKRRKKIESTPGWKVREGTNHTLAYPPSGNRPIIIDGTPSDHRTWTNTNAALKREGFDWDKEKHKK